MNHAGESQGFALVVVKSMVVTLGVLRTESLSNVLRIAVTAAWFNAVLIAFNFSAENRQFLYCVLP
jgi:hypothetical protein